MSDISNLETKIERQSEKLDKLADSVSDLANAITEKTVRDEYMAKELIELQTRVDEIEREQKTIAMAVIGSESEKAIWNRFLTPLINFAMMAVGAGILWAIIGSKG